MTKIVVHARAERTVAAVLGAVSWAAVVVQCYWAVETFIDQGTPPLRALIHALSFFTILTNMLVGTVLLVSAVSKQAAYGKPWVSNGIRTASASYILVVGLVYAVILRKLWNPQGLHFVVDATLHYVVPAGYFLYWVAFVPKGGLHFASVWKRWTIYPLVYLIYSIISGYAAGFFAYPFINFAAIGYRQFSINVIMLVAVFIGMGLLLVGVDQFLGRFGQPVFTPLNTRS